ncbi:MAG: PilZ domain-containing protein [Magnetococcales bacterium]|nr:PilZ domain-containing protein [Magnetococcales bacterium]
MNNNGAYIGNTDNVSETGVFFSIGYPPVKITLGEVGLLHIMPLEGRQPVPCKVARLTDSGVAVQFLKDCPTGLISRLVAASKNGACTHTTI